MTVKEIKERYDGQYVEVEYYVFNGSDHRIKDYTVSSDIDMVITGETKAEAYELMDESEYNRSLCGSIQANFGDWYGDKDAKVLVIVVKETEEEEEVAEEKLDMARAIVEMPGWDGEKDPEELCKMYSEEQILDMMDAYQIEFASPEYEGTELEITEEEKKAVKKAHDRYDAKNTMRISLKFNRNTDGDIIEWLNRQENKQKAIKEAIRKLIK